MLIRTRPKTSAQLSKDECQSLSYYSQPPTGTANIEEVDKLLVERLKLLRTFEAANLKFSKHSDEWKDYLITQLRSFEKTFIIYQSTESQASIVSKIRNDVISHFMLRLSYCRTEDLRKWLLTYEVELFRYRYLQLQASNHDVVSFLAKNDLILNAVSDEEYNKLRDYLSFSVRSAHTLNNKFYKLPFTSALDLVRQRKAYLHKGYVYVFHGELQSVVCSHFRASLSHELARTVRNLPLMEDERLSQRLLNLSQDYIGRNFNNSKSKITLDQLPKLVESCFPPCMRSTYNSLMEFHHLKHYARLTLGLYLKAIGLEHDDALNFFSTAFSPRTDLDQFNKKYSYLIRHMYGKEGKRTSYSAYSCSKIQNQNPPMGSDDYHGCPFKHSALSTLSNKLASYNIQSHEVDEVLKIVQSKQYTLACSKFFEFQQGTEVEVLINHPNQYYEEAKRFQSTGHISQRSQKRFDGATKAILEELSQEDV